MPELPEVETMRRGIAAIVGGRIEGVIKPPCRKRPILVAPGWPALRRRAVGRMILAVDRIGKRVVIRLDGSDALVFEPRMTGLVLLAEPPSKEHLRMQVDLTGCAPRRLLFWDRRGLGLIRLVTPGEFGNLYGDEALGPDALAVDAQKLRLRLGESRRAIKVALLDQRALAGVGNLYAAEILHRARIHPERTCRDIRPREWNSLHAAMMDVLTRAIRYEGSTLADGTYRNALNGEGGFQNHHRVYDREGSVCPTCRKASIERIVQAQRSTFFCPRCQRIGTTTSRA